MVISRFAAFVSAVMALGFNAISFAQAEDPTSAAALVDDILYEIDVNDIDDGGITHDEHTQLLHDGVYIDPVFSVEITEQNLLDYFGALTLPYDEFQTLLVAFVDDILSYIPPEDDATVDDTLLNESYAP